MGYSKFLPKHIEGEDDHPRLLVRDFEKEMTGYRNQWIQKHGENNPFPPFQWQSSLHDHIIRSEADVQNQIMYCNRNPEKEGLVPQFEHWPYSSCSHLSLVDEIVL